MFTNDLSKCVTVNDSNIPLPKRIQTGTKKSKGCAQLPELQKYIDSIIKASNDYDSEDMTMSDKEKLSKERKLGRNTVYKGYDNKIKHEKVQFDLTLNRRKIKNKPKTPFSEAVSRGVEISNKFLCEFEDPRNWNFDTNQNVGPSLEVENFLKKLYPNPYQLTNVNELQTVKSGSVFKKVHLIKETLPDVSKVDNNIELVTEKTNNDLVNADIEIKPSERDHTENNLPQAFNLQIASQPPLPTEINIEGPKDSEISNILTAQTSANQLSRNKSSNSTSNVSSRASSLESMNEIIRKESRVNFKKRKSFKIKAMVSSRESLQKVNKSKSPTTKTHAADENPSDSDIGKLKLLNVSDSDDSATKKFCNTKNSKEDLINEESSELCEEIFKSSDLNELLQIYNIMNKATESFLLLSLKKDVNEKKPEVTETMEDKKFVEFLNSLKDDVGKPLNQENDTKPISKDDEVKNENHEIEDKNNDSLNETFEEKTFKEEKKKTSGKSLLNILLEEEKEHFKFKKNLEERSLDEREKAENLKNENCEKDPVNDSKQNRDQKSEGVNSNANQKADEVLEYMYDCLKKFKAQEKPLREEEKNFTLEDKTQIKKSNKKFSKELAPNVKPVKSKTSQLPKKNNNHCTNEKNNLFTKNFPNAKEIQSRYSSILNENKKPIIRTRYKRRSDILTPPLERKSSQSPPPVSDAVISAEVPNTNCASYPDSLIATNQNCVQTVESHNELGGYTEETQESPLVSNKDLQIAKSILPLPLKLKKSKTIAYKSLKDVLETEEKLLASEFNLKESPLETKTNEENKDLILHNQCLSESATSSAFSVVRSFKRQNSNFVICLNSFPRNFRTVATVRPNIPLPLSISMADIKCWNLRPLPCYPKSVSKKLLIPVETEHFPRKLAYMFRQEALLTLNKTVVAYTARPVCMKVIASAPKSQEISLLKASECVIEKTIKESAKLNASEIGTQTQKNNSTSPSNNEENKPINVVIEAIEETEEKVSLLENHSTVNLHKNGDSLGSSENDIIRNGGSDNELEKESDKKKVHDLLLRTFNLQQKLHRYLHNMTYVQPSSLSCPLIQQEPFLDLGVFVQYKPDSNVLVTETDAKPQNSLPLVHWCLQPPVDCVKPKTDEASTTKILTIDQGTTYNPPTEENSNEQEEENEKDDSSSVCSFKSSNDFSETNESPNETKESSNRVANGVFIKNLFNQIDSFKQSLDDRKLENRDKDILISDNIKEEENRLVEYDSKVPAKVLKTVFRNSKSSTELTIGLKDIQLTKVSNISVEKTKSSPNHTKISICISKEKHDKRNQNRTEMLHNEFSSYYFDSIKPTLSTCQTEHSRLEDDASKSSQSFIEGSEDDEDDYKSAGSTIINSDDEEKSKPKERKQTETAEGPPSKSFTKHKFDFYRKMDLSFEGSKPKHKSQSSSLSRYKELEPLKQALTEMQIRMRGIQRDAVLNSTDYYERALKLAKMSAGYCQSCGTRAVIPNDTFGYYKTLLHRRYTHHRRNKQFRTTTTPNSSFYSFRSSMAEVGDRFCDLDIKHSSSYLLNRTAHSKRTVLRSSLHDMPILFEKI